MDFVAIAYVVGAFIAGGYLSSLTMLFITTSNRRKEHGPNESIPAPLRNAMSWHVVHIRDDVGAICSLLVITNGLLAALVTILLLPRL